MLYQLPILPYCVSIAVMFSAASGKQIFGCPLPLLTELQIEWIIQNSNFLKQVAIPDCVFTPLEITLTLVSCILFPILVGFCEKADG